MILKMDFKNIMYHMCITAPQDGVVSQIHSDAEENRCLPSSNIFFFTLLQSCIDEG